NCKFIFIDPRKTPTNKIVDLHLQVKPGYDLAVMNAIAHQLIKDGNIDEQFIKENVNFSDGKDPITFDDYKRFLEKYTPEYAAEQAGINAADIVKAARMFGESPTAMSMWCMGVNQRVAGVFLNNLILPIHMLSGKLVMPTCASLSLSGQAEYRWGEREAGAPSPLLPSRRAVANEYR